MKILVATKNEAKLRELSDFLRSDFEVASLKDFPGVPGVEEIGSTFEENARMKAVAYFRATGVPSIADDGGIEIDALGGEPGVMSRRWPSLTETKGKPGREKTDEELIRLTIQKLEGVPREKRTACLRIVMTYYDGFRELSASAKIDGIIATEAATTWERGFPFRAIFFLPRFGKLYQNLTPEEHEAVNHRKLACEALRDKILNLSTASL